MSAEAYRAERDLNSYQAKVGKQDTSDTAAESGVNANVEKKFPGSEVRYGPGSHASGSDHRVIPPEEGGVQDDRGHMSKGKDFLGTGGPEDKAQLETERRPGDQDTLTGRMAGK